MKLIILSSEEDTGILVPNDMATVQNLGCRKPACRYVDKTMGPRIDWNDCKVVSRGIIDELSKYRQFRHKAISLMKLYFVTSL